MTPVDFRLYLITDRSRSGDRTLTQVTDEVLSAGAKAIQLREKDLTAAQLFQLANLINESCRKHAAKLFINSRVDIAASVSASGVQLNPKSLPVKEARKILGSKSLIGISTHSLEEAIAAEKSKGDFVLFGPVFSTPRKLKFGEPQGLKRLKEVARAIALPVFAVGGIVPERVTACLDAGAYGVAVISAIFGASNPAKAVAAFRKQLGTL